MPTVYNYNDNVTVILGTSARDNQNLIINSDPNDWWLHMDSVPSGHVIIKSNTLHTMKDISNSYNILTFSAEKCFSGLSTHVKHKFIHNNSAFFYVTVTKIKNLLLTNNIGEVEFIKDHKNILKTIPIKLNLPS